MRRFYKIGILTSLLVGLTACEPASTQAVPPASAMPTEHLSQFQETRRNYFPVKRCINMGNALEAEEEGAWGYTIEAGHFNAIRAAGFDTVRLPIRWDLKTSKRAPYKINPAHMQRVIDVVGQAQAAGLGVIIDVHHYKPLINNPARETARYLAIWGQIAQTFRLAPDNVYFEILNEPEDPMTASQANALYAKVLPVIRQSNPTRPVILGGPSWNAVDTLSDVQWPRDPYLVATFHDYGPYEFTHQGASWMSDAPPMGRRWGGSEDQLEMASTFSIARQFQRSTGLPIFVGEFGVIDTVPDHERAEWLKARRKKIESEGFSWCAWDFAGAFKTYDVNRRQWLPGMTDALTGR